MHRHDLPLPVYHIWAPMHIVVHIYMCEVPLTRDAVRMIEAEAHDSRGIKKILLLLQSATHTFV